MSTWLFQHPLLCNHPLGRNVPAPEQQTGQGERTTDLIRYDWQWRDRTGRQRRSHSLDDTVGSPMRLVNCSLMRRAAELGGRRQKARVRGRRRRGQNWRDGARIGDPAAPSSHCCSNARAQQGLMLQHYPPGRHCWASSLCFTLLLGFQFLNLTTSKLEMGNKPNETTSRTNSFSEPSFQNLGFESLQLTGTPR